jgi:hypothetical protein
MDCGISMAATVRPAVKSPASLWAYTATTIRDAYGSNKEFHTEKEYNLESNATRVCSIVPWPRLWTSAQASPCQPRGQRESHLVRETVSGEYSCKCFGAYVHHRMRHAQCRRGAITGRVHRPRAKEYLGGCHEERTKQLRCVLDGGGDEGLWPRPLVGRLREWGRK